MLKNGVGEMAQWKKKLDTKAHNLSAVAPGPREHCGREVGKNVALGNADSGRGRPLHSELTAAMVTCTSQHQQDQAFQQAALIRLSGLQGQKKKWGRDVLTVSEETVRKKLHSIHV